MKNKILATGIVALLFISAISMVEISAVGSKEIENEELLSSHIELGILDNIGKKTKNPSILPGISYSDGSITKSTRRSLADEGSWKQINQDGFGNKMNVATRGMTTFKGYLCVGVTNINTNGFHLNGCEIWCYDGESWFQSVGNQDGALSPPGFGNPNNGECSVLIEFNSYLYAGTANPEGCEIWRTEDPIYGTWEQVVKNGFGDPTNFGAWSAEIFDGYLYVGTANFPRNPSFFRIRSANFPRGCQIWRTSDGINWEVVVGGNSSTPGGFGDFFNAYAWSITVYNNSIFVGTQNMRGGEIWQSNDGISWKCLVGPSGDLPRGFGYDDNYGIRNLKVFKGKLYAGTATISPLTVCFNYTNMFGKNVNKTIFSSAPVGCQIWRYDESNGWKQIVGGNLGNTSSTNGFGDNENIYAWGMEVFNDSLFVGTFNAKGSFMILKPGTKKDMRLLMAEAMLRQKSEGCEVWKTFDGMQWIQVVGDETLLGMDGVANGFGDVNNSGIRSISTHTVNSEETLFIGTMNHVTGCEIWMYQET